MAIARVNSPRVIGLGSLMPSIDLVLSASSCLRTGDEHDERSALVKQAVADGGGLPLCLGTVSRRLKSVAGMTRAAGCSRLSRPCPWCWLFRRAQNRSKTVPRP